MTNKHFTKSVARGIRIALAAALAGEAGGDFQESDYPDLERAWDWVHCISDKRCYSEDETG